MTIENHEEYMELVQELARNAVLNGEKPETVAEMCVVATGQVVTDGRTLLFSAEPFVDDPNRTQRLWPKDVLTNDDRYPLPPDYPEDLRGAAVASLRDDINHALEGLLGGYEQEAAAADDPPSFEEWVAEQA